MQQINDLDIVEDCMNKFGIPVEEHDKDDQLNAIIMALANHVDDHIKAIDASTIPILTYGELLLLYDVLEKTNILSINHDGQIIMTKNVKQKIREIGQSMEG